MHRSFARLVPVFALAIGIVGCNDNPDDGSMMQQDQPDMTQPPPPDMSLPSRPATDHPPLPTMDYYGGPTLAAPEVWTVVWQGDEALGDKVNTFIDWMLQSDEYWTVGTSEYNVGKGHGMGVIVLPDAAPATIDDSQLTAMVKSHIADGLFPQPNANTVISYVIPKKSKQTMYGGTGCQEYGGYHAETKKASGVNTYVSYAVNLQCTGGGVSVWDYLTEVISHEIAETSTDPHPFTKPGYVNGNAPLGGEDGDLCNPLSIKLAANVDVPDAGTQMMTYDVSRLWSNKNAIAGNADPCQPAPPNTPYFNVGVDPYEIMATAPTSGSIMVQAKIEPYAFGDVGSIQWTLEGQPGTGITVSPDTGTANPGDTIMMQVQIDSTAQSGTYPIVFYNQSSKGGKNLWTSSITIQ
jgi:hypothetical protein